MLDLFSSNVDVRLSAVYSDALYKVCETGIPFSFFKIVLPLGPVVIFGFELQH